ncbi:uncharacterized protein K444DRAFT_17991 [Hyaloscypha bicolor E]|uniref:Uncharacterized protein n=1 Tax=Hyaloscypha bicolor E TaxID=1095630 RepID=A0A2J6TX78_9HELO|nr:uncharacterized protein K444DRAFT_17991 [Hyaloscypha bicolor E]PMD67558.1 hypothetical protein K444DRAFT_17991 [Hyaloscypha bicolor E]
MGLSSPPTSLEVQVLKPPRRHPRPQNLISRGRCSASPVSPPPQTYITPIDPPNCRDPFWELRPSFSKPPDAMLMLGRAGRGVLHVLSHDTKIPALSLGVGLRHNPLISRFFLGIVSSFFVPLDTDFVIGGTFNW